MADNVTIPAQGTGDTTPVVATDNIAGVNYQRVKLSLGGDGTAADAASGAGVVDATVQRVTLGSDDPAVADLDALTAGSFDYDTTGSTDPQIAFGIVTPSATGAVPVSSTNPFPTDVAKINGVTPLMGAGNTGTGSPRVTIATDQVSIPVAATLQAGTALAGKVGIDQTTPGTTNAVRTGTESPAASTWTQVHVPASATQATKSQASAGGSLRNVCTGFTVTVCANGTAPVPTTPVTVQVVDGATGGTTYLWRTNINMPAVAGGIVSINRTGLWLVGSAATAMTIEFSAAGPTNTYQSVAMDGVIVSG